MLHFRKVIVVLATMMVFFCSPGFAQKSVSQNEIDLMLIWANYLNGEAGRVPAPERDAATKKFQQSVGVAPTGNLTREQLDRLRSISDARQLSYQFRLLTDERSGTRIGLPLALLGSHDGESTSRGTEWVSVDKRVRISTLKIPKSEAGLVKFYTNMRNLPGRTYSYPKDDAFRPADDADYFTLEGSFGQRRFHIHVWQGSTELRGLQVSYADNQAAELESVANAMMSVFEPFPEFKPVAVSGNAAKGPAIAGFHARQEVDARLQASEFMRSRLIEERSQIIQGKAIAQRRIALVVGNSDYTSARRLPNAKKDADSIAAALEAIGFEIVSSINGSKRNLENAIKVFSERSSKYDVALVFYAGHGIQASGKNYLLPIDANIEKESDLKFDAIAVDFILEQIEGSTPINIVLLDACRDNPFTGNLARSVSRAVRERPVLVERGLAPILPLSGSGSFIVFATAPGRVAEDGSGQNSPFTEALLKHIRTPNSPIWDVMTAVTADVIASTGGRQRPWIQSALDGKFYFASTRP